LLIVERKGWFIPGILIKLVVSKIRTYPLPLNNVIMIVLIVCGVIRLPIVPPCTWIYLMEYMVQNSIVFKNDPYWCQSWSLVNLLHKRGNVLSTLVLVPSHTSKKIL
jgi:hypothetical protein